MDYNRRDMQINQKASWLFIIIIVFAFVGGGLYFYQNLFQKVKDPLVLVPDNVAVFVEANNLQQMKKAIDQSPAIAKALEEWPGIKSFQEFLPEILETISSVDDQNQQLVISFHPEGMLALLTFEQLSFSEIQTQLKSSSQIQFIEKTFENEYYLELKRNSQSIAISEKRGVFFMSNQPSLIAKSLKQLTEPAAFVESDAFLKLQKISGKRSDGHVFVQYSFLKEWLAAEHLEDPIIEELSHLALWTGLDVNIKDTELMLNGYSMLSDTGLQLMRILKNQESVGMSIVDQFPFETKVYTHLSLNHYAEFYQNWSAFLAQSDQARELIKSVEQMNKKLGSSPEDFHEQCWAGEMGRLKTEEGKEYAVFLSKSGREAFKILSNLAHLSQPSLITLEYQNYKVKELNFKNLLYAHFGPWFKDFQKSYFTIVGELVVFSHSVEDLKAYIDLLEDGLILKKNESYTSFSDNLGRNLNYTYYMNRPQSPNKIYPFLNNDIDKEIEKTAFFKNDLSAISLQMNWKNNMVYTGIFAGLKGKKKQVSSDWQLILESEIIKGPYKVTDHTDGSHKYVVFDDYRQIYLINELGDIVWKKQLEEKPMSDVFEVDYYKNGKIQYLFNTANYIYMIDLTGANIKDFPVQLNSEASAGLTLIDYNNDKDYRILIPGKNGQVYNYKKEGGLLKDWKSKNTNKNIVKPIHHVVANSKDYLIAESDDGDAIMFDRSGKVRMEIRKSFENALGSDFYANRTNSKGMMVTTNSKGKLVYIPEKGKVKQTDFGDFNKDHFFLYNDFTGNGNYDFIYLDQKELQVFDRFKKTLISYVFENDINVPPKIYTLSGRKILCVLDQNKHKLYLFNSDGLIATNIAATSDYLIDMYKGKAFVLAASGKSLKKYPLKKNALTAGFFKESSLFQLLRHFIKDLFSDSKKAHIILECLVRKLREQGLRSFIIRSLHL